MGRKTFRVPGNPRSVEALAADVNRVLEMIGVQLLDIEQPRSPVSTRNQRLTDVGQPSQPNDAVRLQDLNTSISSLSKSLEVRFDSPSSPPPPAIPQVSLNWWGVTFAEAFDGVQTTFTPSVEIASTDGRPHLILVNHLGVMQFLEGDVPTTGRFCFVGSQIEVHPADAPKVGDFFRVVVAEEA